MKVRLDEVCNLYKGKTTITKAIQGKYPLVVTAENRASSNEYQFDCKAVCVPLVSATGHGHASIKRLHYQEGKFALGTILSAVIPKDENILDTKYLYIYLSYFKDSVLVPLMRGSANVSLTIKSLGSAEIEVPSIEE
ncbi:MAG: restriction endonuclease subunit S, partial [Clostridia bacterium]